MSLKRIGRILLGVGRVFVIAMVWALAPAS